MTLRLKVVCGVSLRQTASAVGSLTHRGYEGRLQHCHFGTGQRVICVHCVVSIYCFPSCRHERMKGRFLQALDNRMSPIRRQ